MTQPCDNCGQPSQAPTCDKCLGYQAWASDSGNPRPDSGKRHDQRVRDTRKHLSELPDLYAMLPLFALPGSTPQDPDQRSGKGNPAHGSIMSFAVLDLLDTREKANSDATRTDAGLDSYIGARREGVTKVVHKMALRVDGELWDDDQEHVPAPEDAHLSTDCAFLLSHLVWIAQQAWFLEVHDDVRMIWMDVRAACGERDKNVDKFSCPQCGNESVLVSGGFLSCTMSTLHDVSVRDLEGQYRRRPPLPTRDICEEFHVSQEQVWKWKARNKIKPVNPKERSHKWLPWDVFCLLNPDIRTAIDMRDAAEAS